MAANTYRNADNATISGFTIPPEFVNDAEVSLMIA